MPNRRTSLSQVLLRPICFGLLGCGLVFLSTGAAAQTLEETQNQFLHGNYEDVIQTAQKKLEANGYRDNWRVLLVRALLMVGRYPEADAQATTGVEHFSGGLDLRLLAREAALFQNDPAGANRRLAELKLLIERRFAAYGSEETLVALGRTLLLLGVEPKIVLENCFRRAENLVPPPRDAFLAAGDLALDKHDFALAAETFRAGLKKCPDDPDMQFGLARAFETGNREEMLTALRAALAVNPRHIRALLLLADHLIDAEQYDEAEKQLAAVLKINPYRPEALVYRAVLAHLGNDPAREQQCRDDALKFWKTNPQVDHLLGRKLSEKYRFEEGAAAQRRALAFDPEYLPARRQLASDLLRLGQDAEGWELAQAVHQEDDYDVTAYNLVTLHDAMTKFQTLSNADFIVRMSSHEAGLYGDRVLELLTRAKAALCPKYGVELTRPTIVEIFPEQKDFAVRTFGMPDNPGYLGVCFGSVVTANSPASQAANPANWQDVLWHEFCHVVTLTATKNRMPRWLSEGISVYEEQQAKPSWGESMTLAYRHMILDGELTPLGKLSSAFLTPKNQQHLLFAYYESSVVVDFLVQRFGFETLKAILADLRQGKEMNAILAAHTVPLPDLEKQFSAFIRDRAQKLAPGVDLDKPPAGEASIRDAVWEKSHPDNYYLRMQRAHDLMEAKRWAEAKPVLESLAGSFHGERRAENPLWLLAMTERNLHEPDAELATLRKFAEQESGFVDLYVRLLELSETRKDRPAMMDYAERLLAINPLVSAPYRALAQAGVALGKNDQAIEAYRKLLLLEPPDPAEAHFRLAQLLHLRGGSEGEARRHVLQALEEAPRFREAQRLLLEIKAQTPQPKTSATASNLERVP